MKKVYVIILGMFLVQYCFSQNVEIDSLINNIVKSQGGHLNSVVKADANTYVLDSIANMCIVYNKQDPYSHEKDNIGLGKYVIMLESPDLLKEIAKETFCGNIDMTQVDGWETIYISMSADLSGKIGRVSLTYKSALNIPIRVIEKLEQSIKKHCQLKFDRNNPALAQANYVNYVYVIFVKETCS